MAPTEGRVANCQDGGGTAGAEPPPPVNPQWVWGLATGLALSLHSSNEASV